MHLTKVLFLTMLLPYNSSADKYLSHLLSKAEIWANLPKMWFKYLEAFLYHAHLQGTAKEREGVTMAFSQTYIFCTKFLFKAKIGKNYSKGLKEIQMNNPSARLSFSILYTHHWQLCPFIPQAGQSLYHGKTSQWVFVLSPSFTLNTSVHKLYIPQRNENECTEASLNLQTKQDSVVQHAKAELGIDAPYECVPKIDLKTVKFCGWMSELNVYFSQRNKKVFVACCYQEYSYIDVELSYQVTDVTGVKTVRTTRTRDFSAVQILYLTSIFRVKENFLYSFHFIGSKLSQIMVSIHSTIDSFLVLDGPSHNSKKIQHDNNTLKTSTFQCVVQILVPQNVNRRIFMYKLLSISEHQLHSISEFPVSEQNPLVLNIPGKQCSSSICVLNLTMVSHKLNITLVKISCEGPNSFSCSYAGVSFFQSSKSQEEIGNACSSPGDSSSTTGQSFYSTSNSFILVVYWYPEVNKQEVSLFVSKTDCHPVHVDLCKFTFLCSFASSRSNKQQCFSYLAEITNQTGLFLQMLDSRINSGTFPPTVKYRMNEVGCKVLHFTQSKTYFNKIVPDRCGLHLVANYITISQTFHASVTAQITSIAPACFKILALDNVDGQPLVNDTPNRKIFTSGHISTSSNKNFLHQIKVMFWGASNSWLHIKLQAKKQPNLRHTNRQNITLNLPDTSLDLSFQNTHHFLSLCTSVSSSQQRILKLAFRVLLGAERFPQYHISHTFTSRLFQQSGYTLLESHTFVHSCTQVFHFSRKCFSYSFPGTFSMIKVKNLNNNFNITLSAIWKYNKYDQQTQTVHKCQNHSLQNLSLQLCFNFSTELLKNDAISNHIILGSQVNPKHSNQTLISWNDAAALCIHVGGLLPVFHTDEDLQQLLAFIKTSEKCPFMAAFYVGLSVQHTKKVQEFSFIWQLTFTMNLGKFL